MNWCITNKTTTKININTLIQTQAKRRKTKKKKKRTTKQRAFQKSNARPLFATLYYDRGFHFYLNTHTHTQNTQTHNSFTSPYTKICIHKFTFRQRNHLMNNNKTLLSNKWFKQKQKQKWTKKKMTTN